MTRGGADKMREDPERRCVVTGEVQPKAGLVRFVLSPEGVIFPDLAEKLPGRGIWVTANRDLIAKAAAKERALAKEKARHTAELEHAAQRAQRKKDRAKGKPHTLTRPEPGSPLDGPPPAAQPRRDEEDAR